DQGQEKGYGESVYQISEELTEKLQEWVRNNRLTLNTLIQGAWAYLMSRYSGESDVVFGVTSSGRPTDLIGAENMVGLFINTLPTRIQLTEDTSVVEWLHNIQMKEMERRQYEYSPLVDIHGWSEIPRSSTLFHTLYVFENYPIQGERNAHLRLLEVQSAEQTNYPLTLITMPGKEITLKLMYDRHYFDEETMHRIQGHLSQTLIQMTKNSAIKLSEITYLTPEERAQLLEKWNETTMEMSQEGLICDRFEAQALRYPDAIAVVDQMRKWTYGELDAQANQLAHVLKRKGVVPESVVGVYLPRSAELISSLLGILKAGGAYVVLDPLYPTSRLQYMIEDAGIQIVVTTAAQESIFEQVETVRLDEIIDENVIAPKRRVKPEHLAYIVYTSGSTGKPKGVMVEYRSLMNMVYWHQAVYQITAQDRATQIAGIAFDSAVQEIWPYLTAGAALYLSTEELRIDPEALRDWLIDSKITASFAPTPILERLLNLSWPEKVDLRFIITGGEQLTQYPSTQIPFVVINQYGPSENTVVTTDCYVPIGMTVGTPPIGRPIANTEVYVLDSRLQSVPIGVIGDLYIGGKGLARGYVNRLELTEEKFISHPFKSGERLYYTGDKASYLSDGNLRFHGRIDDQVKIRGFRIELGEIEATLERYSSIKEAVVLVREERPGNQQLVAYIVPNAGRNIDSTKIQAYAAKSLPGYMLPSAIVIMSELPLTPNGKVNRKLLPAPEFTISTISRGPRTAKEEMLCDLFTEVLNLPQIGIDDSFFDLGGHSLLAVQLMNRIKKTLGVELAVGSLFAAPTVAGLAERLELNTSQSALEVILPLRTRGEQLPMFCVHAAGGLSWCYAGLMKSLGDDHPIYGVQARGIAKREELPKSLDEMATDYLEHIREIQPHGPYKLLGWSLGGNVVHAMATHLQSQGEEVELLVMLDSYPTHLLPDIKVPTEEEALIALLALGGFDPENMGGKPLDMENVMDILRRDGSTLANLEEETILNLKKIHVNSVGLLGNYVPKQFHGNLVFFRATIIPEEFDPISPSIWLNYIDGEIEQYDIDCRHKDLCQPGSLAEIGKILADRQQIMNEGKSKICESI
ncbi:non-ribosomal peptide synthetase, partial [Bacillus toyonensis]